MSVPQHKQAIQMWGASVHGLTLNVRMVVAGDGEIPQAVGIVMHPHRENVIVGCMPDTPAERLGAEAACELLGARLATMQEVQEITVMAEVPSTSTVDGSRTGRAWREALR